VIVHAVDGGAIFCSARRGKRLAWGRWFFGSPGAPPMHARLSLAAFAFALVTTGLPADGPLDNQPDKVRPIPPPGVKIADAERAQQLRDGKPSWTTATGLVVRGYKSKIDDSVQPYGLVVPATYKPDAAKPFRLDFWCHGRGEKLTELSFLDGRLKSPGEFTPA